MPASRRIGVLSTLAGVGLIAAASVVRSAGTLAEVTVFGVAVEPVATSLGLAFGALGLVYAAYLFVLGAFEHRVESRRRLADLRNLLRLVFGVAGVVVVLGAATERWLGLLVSFGVVGFAVTFALQQPLSSLLGWVYIAIRRPYEVGDRVAIGDAKGDVASVDLLTTTVWEVDGELVSTNQPSGRVVTVPNSAVLAAPVVNYTAPFDFVWNELTVQVSYETDLSFAREALRSEADDLLGSQMAARVAAYRDRLSETPVELDVAERPTVDVRQRESWVELRLRYLVHPREGTRVRTELYERVLARLNEHPDRVSFPVGRNR